MSVGTSVLWRGLILDNADVRPRRDRTWLPPGFPSEPLKLTPFPAAPKRTTWRSRYITPSHEVSLGVATHALGVIHLVRIWCESSLGWTESGRPAWMSPNKRRVRRSHKQRTCFPSPPEGRSKPRCRSPLSAQRVTQPCHSSRELKQSRQPIENGLPFTVLRTRSRK